MRSSATALTPRKGWPTATTPSSAWNAGESGTEAATIAGKINAFTFDEDSLAKLVSAAAQRYENHVCDPERNNHGHSLIAFLKNYPHVRLYQQEEVDSITGKITKKYG